MKLLETLPLKDGKLKKYYEQCDDDIMALANDLTKEHNVDCYFHDDKPGELIIIGLTDNVEKVVAKLQKLVKFKWDSFFKNLD